MSSLRKLDRIQANLDKPIRKGPSTGTIIGIYNNFADVRLGNSPSVMKNVPIQGNSEDLYIGKRVKVEWGERDGTIGNAPYIAGGASEYMSGTGGIATVTVDNITIENNPSGLSVKRGGIGMQHLNFLPAIDGHTHKTPLELGGWQFTPDGIMYTDFMFIHPQGQMRVGRNNDVIMLDSLDTTYRLWAGHSAPASAPFSVTKAGAIKATSGQIAGWTIDASKIAGGGIEMYSAGYIQSNPFTSGLIGFRIDDDVAEFNNVRVRGELRTTVFTYDEIHANAGTLGVFKSAGILLQDMTMPASPLYMHIKDPETGAAQLFAVGDKLRIKDSSGMDTWFNVTAATYSTDHYRYTVTVQSGTSSGTYRAGAAVVDYGPSGYGFITLSADGGVGSSPNITLATHTGTPWTPSTVSILGRIGNLNGSYGQVTDVYGFAFGDYDDDRYIRWVNSTGVLQIAGTVRIGQGSGFSTPAVIHLPFDGPAPISQNFDVNLYGHLGQAPSVGSNTSSWFGKWHKAVRIAVLTRNYANNPRFEIDTTWWTLVQAGTGGTMTRIATKHFIGAACLQLLSGTNQVRAHSGTIAIGSGANINVQARIWNGGATAANASLVIRDTTNNMQRAIATTTTTGEWELVTAHWYNNTAGTANIEIRFLNDYDDSSTKIYIDAVQATQDVSGVIPLHLPYADGDFPGASWSGTEHNSYSEIDEVDLYYPNIEFPESAGSISMWVNTTIDLDTDNNLLQYFFSYGGSSAGWAAYISSSQYLYMYVGGAGISYALNGTNFPQFGWNHLVFTWNKAATTFKMYLNGVQVGSTGTYGTITTGTTNLYVGNYSTSTQIEGYIDDFALINRELSLAEIQQIYYSDTPLSISGRQFGLYIAETGVGKLVGDAGGIQTYDPDTNWKNTFSPNGLLMRSNASGYNYLNEISIIDPSDYEMLEISATRPTAIAASTTIAAKDPNGWENNLTISSESSLELKTTQTSEQIRIQTAAGYLDLGPINGTWCHFSTDRANFFFYKGMNIIGTGVSITSSSVTPPAAGYLYLSGTITMSNSAMCRVFNSSNISTTTAIWKQVPFDSTSYDDYGWHDAGTSDTKIKPLYPGKYMIWANVEWQGDVNNVRHLRILKNGSTTIAYTTAQPNLSTAFRQQITCVVEMNGTTDYIELSAYQNSGSSLNIQAVSRYSPDIAVFRIV